MGCNSSSAKKEEEEAAAIAAEKQRKRDAANAAMNAPKLDPKDFMLTKLKDQTIVKEPGSINGQQFIIEECENCTIYLLDHSATISIDDCKNCRIFIGPCESSVFIRTSKQLKLIIAAQQLRTRECSDLDILLYVSAGQPVIESSTNIRFGCFHFNYFGLAEQFTAAGLDPWYSEWSNIHDFTASAGSQAYSYLDGGVKAKDFMPLLQDVSSLESLPGFVTPLTYGNRPIGVDSPQRFLVAIAPGQHDALGYKLLDEVFGSLLQFDSGAPNGLYLIRSRRIPFMKTPYKEKTSAIFHGAARKKYEKFVTNATQPSGASSSKATAAASSVLGFEFVTSGADLPKIVAQLEEFEQQNPGLVYISDPAASKETLDLFFENVAVM